MPLSDWFVYLDAAIVLEEESRYWQYVLAGGDPKKWEWRHRAQVESTDGEIARKIIGTFGKRGTATLKGSIDPVANLIGAKKVYRQEDGTFVDEEGNRIEIPPGYMFVPSEGDNSG